MDECGGEVPRYTKLTHHCFLTKISKHEKSTLYLVCLVHFVSQHVRSSHCPLWHHGGHWYCPLPSDSTPSQVLVLRSEKALLLNDALQSIIFSRMLKLNVFAAEHNRKCTLFWKAVDMLLLFLCIFLTDHVIWSTKVQEKNETCENEYLWELFSDVFCNHAYDTIFFHISKPGSGDLHTRLICIIYLFFFKEYVAAKQTQCIFVCKFLSVKMQNGRPEYTH